MKALFKEATEQILNMPEEKFQRALEEAECGDLRWALEYGWNPDLDGFDQWKLCFRHMWE